MGLLARAVHYPREGGHACTTMETVVIRVVSKPAHALIKAELACSIPPPESGLVNVIVRRMCTWRDTASNLRLDHETTIREATCVAMQVAIVIAS